MMKTLIPALLNGNATVEQARLVLQEHTADEIILAWSDALLNVLIHNPQARAYVQHPTFGIAPYRLGTIWDRMTPLIEALGHYRWTPEFVARLHEATLAKCDAVRAVYGPSVYVPARVLLLGAATSDLAKTGLFTNFRETVDGVVNRPPALSAACSQLPLLLTTLADNIPCDLRWNALRDALAALAIPCLDETVNFATGGPDHVRGLPKLTTSTYSLADPTLVAWCAHYRNALRLDVRLDLSDQAHIKMYIDPYAESFPWTEPERWPGIQDASAQTKVQIFTWLLRDHRHPEKVTAFATKIGVPWDLINDKSPEVWAALPTEQLQQLLAPLFTSIPAQALPDGLTF